LVLHIKGRIYIKGIRKQDAERTFGPKKEKVTAS
jgi:hypothetical protein